MLISQTFRGSPRLEQRGYELLQKWYTLTNAEKHDIVYGLAEQLRSDTPGRQIANNLERAINDTFARSMSPKRLPSY